MFDNLWQDLGTLGEMKTVFGGLGTAKEHSQEHSQEHS